MNTGKIADEIFKAYDIRGIVGKTLTPEGVRQIGRAIGSNAAEAGNKHVVVGRDGRLSGLDMVAALTEGILQSGVDVIDIGMVPTPLVYFATHHLDTGASVSVTGSHNPPEYNGFKIMIGGETLSGSAIQHLRERIVSNDFNTGSGQRTEYDIVPEYLDRVCGDIKPARAFKLVIDCGNGIAGAIAPELYRRLGCDVIELFTDVDGTFPNHHPDPIQEHNLLDLKHAVKRHQADFGIAFDGDGDRLGVVAPSGETIWPDRQMILFARDILQRQPGAEIIFDVKCTRALRTAIEDAGGKATMYKTGHSLIKTRLKQSDAALAGEMSGHIFFKERWYGFDDGLYAGARLCELLAEQTSTPAEVFASLPNPLNTPELRLELEEGQQYSLIKNLIEQARFDQGQVHTIDGLRVEFEYGFGLARASNTTPTVILRFEADNQPRLEHIQNLFRELFERVQPGIDLPF